MRKVHAIVRSMDDFPAPEWQSFGEWWAGFLGRLWEMQLIPQDLIYLIVVVMVTIIFLALHERTRPKAFES